MNPYVYANSQEQDILKVQMESLDRISKVGIENPFLSYTSETASKNPNLLQKMSAVMTKYVLGAGSWDNVQQEIDAYTNGTGLQIAKEMMDQYNADH
ncbi:hypothetical protein D3C76_1648610 [compost metagenome]